MALLLPSEMICGFCNGPLGGDSSSELKQTGRHASGALVAIFYCGHCGAILAAAGVTVNTK